MTKGTYRCPICGKDTPHYHPETSWSPFRASTDADTIEALTQQVAVLQRERDTLRHAAVMALDFILHRQGNDAAETVVVADLRSAIGAQGETIKDKQEN